MFDVLRKIFVFVVLNGLFLMENSCLAQQQKNEDNEEKFIIVGTKEQAEHDWMEKLHSNVSDTVFQSALWFDSFFTEDDTQQQDPLATARIRLAWEPKAGDWNEYKAKFRLRVKLPHFKDKLDLILSDDDSDNINRIPLETVGTTPDINDEHLAAAVRFVHTRTNTKIIDQRIGISSGDIFYRARYQQHFVVNKNHAFKVEPAIYYYLDDGLGARFLAEYEYQLNLQEQLRVNYSVRGSESFSGIRWKHAFYHLKQFSLADAGAIGLVVEGERNGSRGFVIDKYTLSYRYRFNAVKSWLFFDIEPFLEWPENQDYKTVPGIAFRVEGYFTKD